MTSEICYRPAQESEAGAIARGLEIAGGGFVEFVLPETSIGSSSRELIIQEVKKPEAILSYCCVDVAVVEEQVVGGALSIPVERLQEPSDIDPLVPHDRYAVLEDFFALGQFVPNSWYLDSLWVDVAYRRQGIGQELIHQAQTRGIQAGRPTLSLVSWATNTGAIAFYQAQGFEQVRPIPVGKHPAIPHPEGFILFQRSC